MSKEIFLNGGLRTKNNEVILTLYSTPLARLFMKKKIESLNIKYTPNFFILEPGNQRKMTIERKKENRPLLTTRIAKLIPNQLILDLKKEKKQRKIQILIKGIAVEKDLVPYNNLINYATLDSLDINIPEAEKIKVGCHISCFRSKNSFSYRLSIRHRILEEIAIKKEKVAVARTKKGDFIIKKCSNGRSFNFHKNKKGYPLAYMQISPSLITKKENELFELGKRCISFRAYLSRNEFNLDISQFFATKDEKELAYALLKRGINIRIPEMRKREADIVLKNSGIQIELTHLKPREKEGHKNNPHSEGVHINARICEGYLRVTQKLTPFYFVVFNKKWLKYKWVNDLILIVQPYVSCITTDFNPGWEESAADKINLTLKDKDFPK